jgi:quercetin dioxygenase-like cupin family protein
MPEQHPPALLRRDEPIQIVPKGWGEERWIHNDELYCGKLLIVKQGKRCSLHYHQLKTESFYIVRGRLRLELTDLNSARQSPPLIREVHELAEGDALLLKPGDVHRFTALTDEAWIIEFSTQHFDADSHRIERGD